MEELWNRGGLVEVLNSTDANYISIASTLLSDHGFFVRVENEHTYTNLVTGISLMVREEQGSEAIRVLVEAGIIPGQSASPEEINSQMQEEVKSSGNKIWRLIFILLVILSAFAIWTILINKSAV